MNVIALWVFELIYYDVAVEHISDYATKTHLYHRIRILFEISLAYEYNEVELFPHHWWSDDRQERVNYEN